MNYYHAYGLVFQSEIELPELQTCTHHRFDVTVSFSKIKVALDKPEPGKNRFWKASKNRFTISVKNIGCFHVENGDTILIEPHENALDDDLRFVLLGSVMAALLQQRGYLVLHAGAIQTKKGAVLFTGPSGNGKSTLTAALLHLGHTVISDDIVAVDTSGERCHVLPAFPRLRLWADAASHLNYDCDHLQTARAGLKKYIVPIHNFAGEPNPMHKIYVLDVHNGDTITIDSATPGEKIAALIQNSYRFRFLSGLGLVKHHHKQITSIARDVDISRLERPLEPFRIDRLIHKIEQDLNL